MLQFIFVYALLQPTFPDVLGPDDGFLDEFQLMSNDENGRVCLFLFIFQGWGS